MCKNSPTCEWKSCEFLHNTDQLERESAETNAGRKSLEDRINKNELKLNNFFDCMKKIFEKEVKALTDRIDTIEEEYSSKLEEIDNSCKKIMTKSEKNKLKIIDLENKYEILLTQINKSKKSEDELKSKETNQSKSKVDVLPMKLENGKIVPATRSESANSILAVHDNNKSSLTKQKHEVENSCEFCPNKFKSLNNLQNHVAKFHGNNKQFKCTLCAMSFSNKKILDTHIISVHQKENSKHTIEREPSLSNHKQKKNNL